MSEPIRLDKADYFELKALTLQAQCLRLEAEKAQYRADEAAAKAQAKLALFVTAPDGMQMFRFDDVMCALVTDTGTGTRSDST
jgi:hypothetical protein